MAQPWGVMADPAVRAQLAHWEASSARHHIGLLNPDAGPPPEWAKDAWYAFLSRPSQCPELPEADRHALAENWAGTCHKAGELINESLYEDMFGEAPPA